jgi:hypothetical protein
MSSSGYAAGSEGVVVPRSSSVFCRTSIVVSMRLRRVPSDPISWERTSWLIETTSVAPVMIAPTNPSNTVSTICRSTVSSSGATPV